MVAVEGSSLLHFGNRGRQERQAVQSKKNDCPPERERVGKVAAESRCVETRPPETEMSKEERRHNRITDERKQCRHFI